MYNRLVEIFTYMLKTICEHYTFDEIAKINIKNVNDIDNLLRFSMTGTPYVLMTAGDLKAEYIKREDTVDGPPTKVQATMSFETFKDQFDWMIVSVIRADRGKRIQMIRLTRMVTGCMLKDAKEFVDDLMSSIKE